MPEQVSDGIQLQRLERVGDLRVRSLERLVEPPGPR
jgi:hypothetical protein